MIQREVKPITEGSARPPKGRLTWLALAAMVLFVLVLIALFVRPLLSRNDAAAAESSATGPVAP